jgi:LytTr DNA-binding domain
MVRVLITGLVFGVMLGLLGPFGTFERMPMGERLTFWVLTFMSGIMLHVPLYWLGAWVGQEWRVPVWIWLPLSACVAAAPMTLMVNGVAAAMFGDIALDSFVSLYWFVLAISLPAQILNHWVIGRIDQAGTVSQSVQLEPSLAVSASMALPAALAPLEFVVSEPGPIPVDTGASFFSLLPARLGKAVLCLEMEDHYLRVRTDRGDAMIYMRMADAETRLAGMVEGMRVHRSWWVARAAITGWERDGKTLTLTLSTGQKIPVARDRQPLVKAAGWLA